ncbi:PilZ domain-containing protein [Thermodesulfovibrio sp. 3462-1]|jgi:tRNA-binding EMAP/Myf-like protein|uniref:PilZ domain-containing protein n=1 Tax=Thermodesulfovibrio obliviosus TaxID=3118332 RepID=A0AAU8H3D4_9BACT
MINMEESYQKMREFSRVDAVIPLQVRLVCPEERQKIKARIFGEVSFFSAPVDEPADKALAQWIKLINSKLDYLISLWSLRQEGFCELPLTEVNISGGGMSFISHECYSKGDILELKMVLESPQSIAMFVYGEVVKCERINNSYKIAVKFINIDEDIRDYIVRFVFHRQRQLIRQKREI